GVLMFAKQLMAVWLSCILILSTCSLLLAKGEQKTPKKASTITLTGCLQNGYVADRFTLTTKGQRTYALRSASVKLFEHVGQKVSIKGQLARDPKRDEYEFEGSEINEGYGKDKLIDPLDVDVTRLKVVNSFCR